MRFNPNCVRDLLFTIEENTGYNKEMVYGDENNNYSLLTSYSNDEIMYHLSQCKNSGLIDCIENIKGDFEIKDLTSNGHALIAQIRDEKMWKKIVTKTISSIPALVSVASEVYSLINFN